MTLEVKVDRVYQTFQKMVFENVQNLLAIAGDAMTILPRHFSEQSVDEIFVNHPEPPQQQGGEDSEAKHLLDEVIESHFDEHVDLYAHSCLISYMHFELIAYIACFRLNRVSLWKCNASFDSMVSARLLLTISGTANYSLDSSARQLPRALVDAITCTM